MSDVTSPEMPGSATDEIVSRFARRTSVTLRALFAAALGAAVLLLAGCGGLNPDAAGTTEKTDTSAAGKASSSKTTGDKTSSSKTTTSGGGTSAAGLSDGCQKVAAMSAVLLKAIGAGEGGGNKNSLAKTAKAYRSLAAKVPKEIRPAFRTLATAYAQYAVALKGVDLSSGTATNPKTAAKLKKATKSLDTKSLSAANTQIAAWAKENCDTGG